MKPKGIVVGMSGGVDSTIAAGILSAAGYRVVGVTLRFHDRARSKDLPPSCCDDRLIDRCRRFCARAGIAHRVIDVEREFAETVVRDFVEEYRAGRTPNPCVVCNEKVKFPALLSIADRLGCEKIATGHYAKIVREGGRVFLASASDGDKDQSYFLYRVPVGILRRTLFPLGTVFKETVREAAASLGCETESESQDICFLSDGDLRRFLRGRIATRAGEVVDREGRMLGTHEGAELYTIGQRKGFGIAGQTALYVAGIDTGRNRVILAPREHVHHIGARCGRLKLRRRELGSSLTAKIRYRRPAAEVVGLDRRRGGLEVRFREAQWAVTPGQSLVLYDGGVVVGGGVIEEAIENE
jgi:tRNA-specific 2-thiouridylase